MFAPSDHSTTSTPPDRPNTLDPHWITELLPFLACTHRLNTFPSRLHDYTADIRRAEELVNEPIMVPPFSTPLHDTNFPFERIFIFLLHSSNLPPYDSFVPLTSDQDLITRFFVRQAIPRGPYPPSSRSIIVDGHVHQEGRLSHTRGIQETQAQMRSFGYIPSATSRSPTYPNPRRQRAQSPYYVSARDMER